MRPIALFCRNHHLFTVSILQKVLPPKQILSKLIAIIQEIFERDLLVSISTFSLNTSLTVLVLPEP